MNGIDLLARDHEAGAPPDRVRSDAMAKTSPPPSLEACATARRDRVDGGSADGRFYTAPPRTRRGHARQEGFLDPYVPLCLRNGPARA